MHRSDELTGDLWKDCIYLRPHLTKEDAIVRIVPEVFLIANRAETKAKKLLTV